MQSKRTTSGVASENLKFILDFRSSSTTSEPTVRDILYSIIENILDSQSRIFSMVHPSERSCNYAKGRFDGRKMSISSLLLSLKVPYPIISHFPKKVTKRKTKIKITYR